MNLYNVKSITAPTPTFLCTKFDEDFNIEASYITTLTTCECPAGQRPTCRHRQMLPQFIENKAVDANLFYDFDTKTFYDGPREEPLDDVVMDTLNEPSDNLLTDEEFAELKDGVEKDNQEAILTTQTEVLATMAEVVSETEPKIVSNKEFAVHKAMNEFVSPETEALTQDAEMKATVADITGIDLHDETNGQSRAEKKFELEDQARGLWRRI